MLFSAYVLPLDLTYFEKKFNELFLLYMLIQWNWVSLSKTYNKYIQYESILMVFLLNILNLVL